MANVANEASTDVDSPQSLKIFIIATFNRYLSLLLTGQFFTIFGHFCRNDFCRFDSF
jgi:hypothetical protein